MVDLIKKTMMTGIGLAFMTKDKIEEVANELVEKAKMSEKDAKEFIDTVSEKSEEARKKVDDKIRATVTDVLEGLDVARTADIQALQARIERLEALHAADDGAEKDEKPSTC